MTARQTGAKGKADRLFSLLVRSGGRCAACGWTCGCPDRPRSHTTACRLQCAHVFSRRYSLTRCDLENAYPLCASCHHRFTAQPTEWGRWVMAQMGEDAYLELYQRANRTSRVDWQAVAADLTEQAKTRGVL